MKNGMEELVVGGQRGLFPANACVRMDMVLSAAGYFFETQKLKTGMDWEE